MDKIYKQAKDEHVAGVIVYAYRQQSIPQGSYVAYKDEAGTEKFTTAELADAFFKGCVIVIDEVVKPTQFTPEIKFYMQQEVKFAFLYGYYDKVDGDECTPFSVFTWDGCPEFFDE